MVLGKEADRIHEARVVCIVPGLCPFPIGMDGADMYQRLRGEVLQSMSNELPNTVVHLRVQNVCGQECPEVQVSANVLCLDFHYTGLVFYRDDAATGAAHINDLGGSKPA